LIDERLVHAHLKWAFSEAACLFLRNNHEGQNYHLRLVGKHGKAKALSILSHKIGRAVYFMLKRKVYVFKWLWTNQARN
jgi:hypothetical protein